jgi:hypothetical protein
LHVRERARINRSWCGLSAVRFIKIAALVDPNRWGFDKSPFSAGDLGGIPRGRGHQHLKRNGAGLHQPGKSFRRVEPVNVFGIDRIPTLRPSVEGLSVAAWAAR